MDMSPCARTSGKCAAAVRPGRMRGIRLPEYWLGKQNHLPMDFGPVMFPVEPEACAIRNSVVGEHMCDKYRAFRSVCKGQIGHHSLHRRNGKHTSADRQKPVQFFDRFTEISRKFTGRKQNQIPQTVTFELSSIKTKVKNSVQGVVDIAIL